MSTLAPAADASAPSLFEIAAVFFRLGATAFGGPAAHIPAVVMTLVLAWVYVRFGMRPDLTGAMMGVRSAILMSACLMLSFQTLQSGVSWLIFLLGVVALLLWKPNVMWVVLGGGCVALCMM